MSENGWYSTQFKANALEQVIFFVVVDDKTPRK
jgi:hypothetical protein